MKKNNGLGNNTNSSTRNKTSSILTNKTILVTGGTGSFGKAFIKEVLTNHNPRSLRILSRDELKQWEIANEWSDHPNFDKLRFFIGDVRDKDRLLRAFEGVDFVIHAAALKQIPSAEYNPFECIKTNIIGAENVINATLDCGVEKVVALSTDKAAAPINLYGATKLCSDKLFVAANNMRGKKNITFSVVRYGNVMGSRGSVIPYFLSHRSNGVLPITHPEMTRFNITLDESIRLVLYALENSWGGEIFVPKIPSFKIVDLATAVAPDCKTRIIGIRPGEKLHEEMITENDSFNTIEIDDYFVIIPSYPIWSREDYIKKFNGKPVAVGFKYNSGSNSKWLSVTDLNNLIKENIDRNFELE